MPPFALLALALAGCRHHPDDTEPARPADLRISVPPATEGEIVEAEVPIGAVTVDRCRDLPASTTVGGGWFLVPPAPMRVAGGEWCGLTVSFEGPLALLATARGGSLDATITVADVQIALDPALEIDADALLLRLGDDGWLDLGDLRTDVVLDPESPAHAALSAALSSVGLYADDDEDGLLSDDELASGSLTDGS